MQPTDTEVEFKLIPDVAHPDFERAIALYRDTFPPRERIPIPRVKSAVASGRTQLWAGYYQGELALMSIVEPLPISGFLLLGYLATNPQFRNLKLGSRFLQYIIDGAKRESKSLVLEVEHPDFGGDRELKERRIGFYRRFGAKILGDIVYILPPLDGGSQATEMMLMVILWGDRNTLSKTTVQQLIRELYVEVYRRHPDEPIFNWIEDIPEEIDLV
ncbi:GNAT family N-acetyltransferase [Lyngbya sp. CCY1209]|uniref:GNAT family N-acetyltransferase n=1 Tax=Lyngbya sp. CCY1209 TaxID=2886103 RepID=UPI002D208EBE|nr:GNAT family N-acetyltransferase [Lyngbya sp. CCY1209]MEB3887062.1 GNAT family N-acetyltransferase [Lyngbya sp. CCY1209]